MESSSLLSNIMNRLDLHDVFYIIFILCVAWLFALLIRWALNHFSDFLGGVYRLKILRIIPLMRLLVGVFAFAAIVPIIVPPTFENVLALIISSAVLLAFIFKDYASGVAAGFISIIENNYQVGDWVEMDGVYGEVKLVNLRCLHIVTSEDNEIIIPHNQIWLTKIVNATTGSMGLLCVANFYLDPEHDGALVVSTLKQIAKTSIYLKPASKISVVANETPTGTHYKLKAYVKESKDQFLFVTDMTVRGKHALLNASIKYAHVIPIVR